MFIIPPVTQIALLFIPLESLQGYEGARLHCLKLLLNSMCERQAWLKFKDLVNKSLL